MLKFSKLDHSNLCLNSVEDFGKIAKYNDHFQQQDEVALFDLMLFNFFNFKNFFFLEISILDEKCDLLMDIMLMSLKKWQSKRGAKKRHLQLFEPLHFSKFLSYINMMHFKRSLFLCRIEISIKNLLFEMKKLEKKPIEKYHFILLLKMVILLRDFP